MPTLKSNTPHHWLIPFALALILLTPFFWQKNIDIQMHDVYLVLSLGMVFLGLALILLLFWWVYRVFLNHYGIKRLNLVHILITLICLSILLSFDYWRHWVQPVESMQGLEAYLFKIGRLGKILLGILGLFSIAQILFILNLGLAWFKSKTHHR